MDKEELSKLPPVLFAPFLAAGTLAAYFGGGFAGGIIFAAAAAFSICFARKKPKAAVCAAGAALGAAVMLIYTMLYVSPVLKYAETSVCSEVRVSEVTEGSGDSQQFIGKMRLGLYPITVRLTGESRVEAGDTFVAVIDLKSADSENELRNLANGILLSGDVSEFLEIKRSPPDLISMIGNFRGEMLDLLNAALFGESRELARSMFFGKDEGLSQSLSERIKISGVSHFTAVSGAHFAVLASVLLQLFPSKNRRARAVFSFFITPCALIFFGVTLSVLRSSLMFLIMSAAPLFHRTSNPLNSLCAAVCVILTVMPQSILDIGFAMSVLGVFGAGVAGPLIARKLGELLPEKAECCLPIITAFFSSLCAVICTAPVSAAVFNGVSLNAVLASILLMPLLTVGMTFTLLLGITGAGAFAVPIDITMKIILRIIEFFGGERTAFLNLDFQGAWILSAICAILVAVAAFGNMKTLRRCGIGVAVISAVSVGITVCANANRSEIRFVGNSTTSAAVVLYKDEAAVFVSGSGVGLADDISRCMRERGAYKINGLVALDADFCGELAVRELSELIEIDSVILGGSYSGFPSETAGKDSVFSVNGITIASASVSDAQTSADIVLYHGSITKPPQSSAKLAVYFTNSKHELPKNAVNIYRSREYRVKLSSEGVSVRIE